MEWINQDEDKYVIIVNISNVMWWMWVNNGGSLDDMMKGVDISFTRSHLDSKTYNTIVLIYAYYRCWNILMNILSWL